MDRKELNVRADLARREYTQYKAPSKANQYMQVFTFSMLFIAIFRTWVFGTAMQLLTDTAGCVGISGFSGLYEVQVKGLLTETMT